MEKIMKRRSLFKVSAFSAFAISSTAAHALTLNPSQKWDGEYDVIIVGAGGAGLGCAIETTDRKLKTLILEKMPFVGGASAICGGQYSAANTPYQIERGIKDDGEHFLKNMLDIGGHVNDPELVKAGSLITAFILRWFMHLQEWMFQEPIVLIRLKSSNACRSMSRTTALSS